MSKVTVGFDRVKPGISTIGTEADLENDTRSVASGFAPRRAAGGPQAQFRCNKIILPPSLPCFTIDLAAHQADLEMIRYPLAFAIVAVVVLSCDTPSRAADPISPVGTWRVMSYTTVTVDTNEVSQPYGDKPIGYIQYSPGGHMVVFLERGDPEQPANLRFSDAERVKFFNYLFGAYAGTYTVEANKITHHVAAAWRPDWVGHDQIRYAEINGNKLTITTAPVIASLTGKQVVATLTFERLE